MTIKQTSSFDWRALLWAFVYFWYFSAVAQIIIQVFDLSNFVGFRQAFLVSALWLAPLVLFPQHTKKIAAAIGLVLWASSIPALAYLLVYHQEFSQSVIFIIFESNVSEGTEYLQQYFSWGVAFALLAYTLIAYVLWKKVRPIVISSPKNIAVALLFFFTSIGYQAINQTIKQATFYDALVTFQKRLEPAAPFQLVVGYISYRQQLANMQALLDDNKQLPPLEELSDKTAGKESTLVLVIGESTNRQRMSIYGYERKTTPELDKLREQLLVFDNVVTPIPYTIEALERVLTFADENNPTANLTQPSLINMMKQAGYKTYWITNQQTLTQRNTMLTVFSKQADEQVYLNNNREQNSRQYDSSVFEPFDNALKEDAPRKFIVVHLLGTHMKYDFRYPPEWEFFKSAENAPSYLSSKQLSVYNAYDNSQLFNDFVVSSLIKQLAEAQANSLLLYLSDHGEAVYDIEQPSTLGRNAANSSSDMYTIPFLLWLSPQWQENYPRDVRDIESRPYNTEDFIYTWADLAGIGFKDFDASRSVVSDQYISKPLFANDPHKTNFIKEKIINKQLALKSAQ